jgi:hypothetical protein
VDEKGSLLGILGFGWWMLTVDRGRGLLFSCDCAERVSILVSKPWNQRESVPLSYSWIGGHGPSLSTGMGMYRHRHQILTD